MIDALYGRGTWKRMLAAVRDAPGGLTVEGDQANNPNDSVRVWLHWKTPAGEPVGYLKADHYADRVVWVHHQMDQPGGGALGALVRGLGPIYAKAGVARMEMTPRTDEVPVAHRQVGFVQDGDKQVLDLVKGRGAQYLAWKLDGGDAPGWRL